MTALSALPARLGYRLWAPSYDHETAVSHLENLTVAELGVPTDGRRLLDVGCGTARRLLCAGAAFAAGADLTYEMIAGAASDAPLSAADVRALPFASGSFDVVWCRLVVGHVRDLEIAYSELSRVCAAGGAVVVTDFCPEAVAAGHRRTFRDAAGVEQEVEHFVHTVATHAHAAFDVGLKLKAIRDGVVDDTIRDFYARADRLAAFEQQRGLPMVRALSWRKMAAAAA